ncbi:MAG: PAS domain S-box protein, partial [Bacteroidota bacterium]
MIKDVNNQSQAATLLAGATNLLQRDGRATTKKQLRVLIVEDSEVDAELIVHELTRGGFDVVTERVDTEAEFLLALESKPWDAILCDYRMPEFDGMTALRLYKEQNLDMPFIIVSAVMSEDLIVEVMRAGAHDYVMKSHLNRLTTVMERQIHDTEARRESVRTTRALRESEERYRDLVENSRDLLCTHDLDGNLLSVNEAAVRLTGYSCDVLLRMNMADLIVPGVRHQFSAYLKKVRSTGQASGLMQIQTASGAKRYWEYDNTLRIDRVAKPIVYGMAHDVTERNASDVALRKSEERYRVLFDSNPNPMWVYDLKTLAFLTVNDSAVEKYGYTRDEFLRMTIADIRPTEDLQRLTEDISLARPILNHAGEWHHRLKNGTIIDVDITSHTIRMGDHDSAIVVAHDVTARKQAEAKLCESEERFSRLAQASFEGIAIHDKGTILDGNQSLADLFGFELSEIIGKNALDLTAPESRDLVRKNILAGSEKPYEAIGLRKDGTRFGCELIGKSMHYQGRVVRVTALRDITERKNAGDALRKSEEKYRGIFENVQDVYYESSVDGTILEVSPSIEILTKGQYRRDDLMGKSMYDFYSDPGDRQALLLALQERGSLSDFEILLKNRDGSQVPCSISAKIRMDEQGRPHKIIGSLRDITDRKKAEESQVLLTTALESTANGVLITDFKGKIAWVNKAFMAMTGYTWTEVHGKNPNILKSGKQDDLFYKNLWKTITAGNVWQGELINEKKDGSLYVDEMTITPLKNKKGEITNFIAIKQDITARKKAQSEITMLGQAVKSATECISITDLGENVIYVNDAFLKTYGYQENEILGENIEIIRSRNNKAEEMRKILPLTIGGSWQGELMNLRKDGSEFPVSLSTSVVTNEKGNATALIGVAVDISERKLAEQTLKDSEERLRILFEYAPDAYYLNDLKGNFVDGNKAAEELTGYQRKELIGNNMLGLGILLPNQVVKVASLLAQNVFGRPTGPDELHLKRKDGSEVTVEIRTYPVKVKDKTLVLGIARNITKRKRAEEQLHQSESSLKTAQEIARMGNWEFNFEKNTMLWSENMYNIFGLPLHGIVPTNDYFRSRVDPGDLHLIDEAIKNVGKEKAAIDQELRIILPDGGKKWIQNRLVPVFDHGRLIGLKGVCVDISGRKLAEDEIHKNRELLKSIYETSRDGIILEDERGIITFVNTAFVRLYKYKNESDLVGQHVSIVQAPEDNERMLEFGRKRVKGEHVPSIYEFKGKCKDGSLIDLEVSVAVTEIGGKKHILSVVRDIRDRKKAESDRELMEDRIRQAQKLESIGTLAGGIAHDFNNILGIILGHLSIV